MFLSTPGMLSRTTLIPASSQMTAYAAKASSHSSTSHPISSHMQERWELESDPVSERKPNGKRPL